MLVLSTDSLNGYGLNRIFSFAKDADYDGIDLMVDPKDFDTQDPQYVKELVNEYKVPVVSIQAPADADEKVVGEIVSMAKVLGTKVIIVQPPRILNFKYARWLKNEVPKIRKKEEISIALSNAPAKTILGFIPDRAMNNVGELRKFKHACIDTSLVEQKQANIIHVYGQVRKFLVHVHLSNISRGKIYSLPEDGKIPLESFLTKLRHDNFKGAVSIKVKPKYMQVGEDDKVLKNLKDTRKFYIKYFLDQPVGKDEEENEF